MTQKSKPVVTVKNSQGFSLAIAMVTVWVIAVLAGAGWYVWNKNKNEEGNKSQDKTSQKNEDNKKDPATPADPSENGKYLVIREWGVRFELPEEIRDDVEYGILVLNSGDQIAYFASKRLAAKSTVYGCGLEYEENENGKGKSGGVIAVTRTNMRPEDTPDALIFEKGGYIYVLGFSNGGTCYDGDTGEETSALKTLLDPAIRSLEPIMNY